MSKRNPETGKRTSRDDKNMKAGRREERRRLREERKRLGLQPVYTKEQLAKMEHCKAWRFKPGHKLRLGKRPPPRKPISDRYREALEALVPEKERLEMSLPPGAKMGDAIAVAMSVRAVKGRQAVQAAAEMREAVEGKATQQVDVKFLNELPERLRKARAKLRESDGES